MSQSRRRPVAPQTRKRRPQSGGKKSQRLYAILGVVVAISLIGTVIGPPIIDFLTQRSEDSTINVDQNTSDPVKDDYLAQIKAEPNNAQALAGFGSYLGNTGSVAEAIGYYERALALEPEDWDIRLGFAQVLSRGDKRADAELQFKKVIIARPNDFEAHFSLAQLYANWVPPRTEEAITEYQTVIRTGGDSFAAQRAAEELVQLGIGSPVTGSPAAVVPYASPIATEVS